MLRLTNTFEDLVQLKMKISQINTCKYCNEPVKSAQKRCKKCGSWLGFKPYLCYPETCIIIIGLLVSILACLFAWKESYDTYLERQKVEKLEASIQGLAAKVTMLSVVGSASAKKDWSKSASQYAGELKMYQNQVVEQLPLNLRQEVNKALIKFESKDVESLHEK